MISYKCRYSILFKTIAIVLVCLFIVNDITWAQPDSFNPPKKSTLAPLVGNPETYADMRQVMIAKH